MGTAEALGGCFEYQPGDAFRISECVVVPNPHDSPTFRFEKLGPTVVIVLLLKMLATVEFDRQLCFAACEIDYVRTNH